MTKSGKSLYYFGIYVVCIGLLFILIPDSIISLNKLPALADNWARVVGLLALVIGTYDILCGKMNVLAIIKASVYVRIGFVFGVVLLVATSQMPLSFLPLGAMDAIGAFWTYKALQSETSSI